MIEFAAPWWFLALPIPLLIRYLLPPYRAPRVAVRAPFIERVRRVTGAAAAGQPATTARRSRWQWLTLAMVWLALVAAIARPQWLDEPVVRELPMRDLLVALDLSGSMETTDFTDAGGNRASRLQAALEILDSFLARREGDRAGLVFFGSAAFVQAPFTDDLDVVRELLGEARVRMLGPRTVLGDAIGVAIGLFERSEVDERVLITLTDGNDTGSLIPPLRAAEIAADSGVTVFTVAMGDPQSVGEQALDEDTLKAIADATGGEYFHAESRDELEGIYATLDQLNPRQVETLSYRPRNELFHWPLAGAVVFSVLLFGWNHWLAWWRRRPIAAGGDRAQEAS